MRNAHAESMLRGNSVGGRVTNVELFFDLVYVFAVTQLSQHLLDHPTVEGALQTALLLAMVWQVWAYTTWMTNWLDPERIPVRSLLLVLMLVSLVMSAALPRAFETGGLAVGGVYAIMQIGRSVFIVAALKGQPLQRNFQRILAWCVVSGALAVAGGTAHGHARELLWLGAVGTDLLGGFVGFYTPLLGRSHVQDWTIAGNLFAERCQAFVLIALGESVVTIGATLTSMSSLTPSGIAAFVAAFVGVALLWWVYFDRSAEAGARIIAASQDPGRLGRSAYHFIHPVMIAGIIVTAAADEKVLSHPLSSAAGSTGWMILGGTALFLAGHAWFKLTVWRTVPWTRASAVLVLALLGLAASHVSALSLGACADAVVVAVVAADRLQHPASSHDQARPAAAGAREDG